MLQALILLAEEGAKPQGDGGGLLNFLPFLAMLFLLWIIVLRPMSRRQQQEREAMATNLKKNDKVITTAGIYGTVISVAEKEDEVVVKVDDNVRLRMTKSSIARNLTNEEAAKAAKAAKEQAKKEGAA